MGAWESGPPEFCFLFRGRPPIPGRSALGCLPAWPEISLCSQLIRKWLNSASIAWQGLASVEWYTETQAGQIKPPPASTHFIRRGFGSHSVRVLAEHDYVIIRFGKPNDYHITPPNKFFASTGKIAMAPIKKKTCRLLPYICRNGTGHLKQQTNI